MQQDPSRRCHLSPWWLVCWTCPGGCHRWEQLRRRCRWRLDQQESGTASPGHCRPSHRWSCDLSTSLLIHSHHTPHHHQQHHLLWHKLGLHTPLSWLLPTDTQTLIFWTVKASAHTLPVSHVQTLLVVAMRKWAISPMM